MPERYETQQAYRAALRAASDLSDIEQYLKTYHAMPATASGIRQAQERVASLVDTLEGILEVQRAKPITSYGLPGSFDSWAR